MELCKGCDKVRTLANWRRSRFTSRLSYIKKAKFLEYRKLLHLLNLKRTQNWPTLSLKTVATLRTSRFCYSCRRLFYNCSKSLTERIDNELDQKDDPENILLKTLDIFISTVKEADDHSNNISTTKNRGDWNANKGTSFGKMITIMRDFGKMTKKSYVWSVIYYNQKLVFEQMTEAFGRYQQELAQQPVELVTSENKKKDKKEVSAQKVSKIEPQIEVSSDSALEECSDGLLEVDYSKYEAYVSESQLMTIDDSQLVATRPIENLTDGYYDLSLKFSQLTLKIHNDELAQEPYLKNVIRSDSLSLICNHSPEYLNSMRMYAQSRLGNQDANVQNDTHHYYYYRLPKQLQQMGSSRESIRITLV